MNELLRNLLLVLLPGIFALMLIGSLLRVYRRTRKRWALVLPVLRLILLALIGWLFWIAFWDFSEAPASDQGDDRSPRLLVIHDRSLSMEFAAGDGRTRREVAEQLRRQLDQAVAGASTKPEVRHLLLGANLVDEAGADRLRRQATQLNHGLAEALNRFHCDRLLLLSDGAATDGFPPAYLRDWMTNQRIEVTAICPLDPTAELFDAQLLTLQALPINPTRAEVSLLTYGEAVARVTVQLLLDGQVVSAQTTDAVGRTALSFRLPLNMEEGWHLLEARILPTAGEVTTENNRRLMVFRITPPNQVLFLYDSPRRENLHLVQTVRSEYADRLVVHQISSREIVGLNMKQYKLVVLSGIQRGSLPTSVENFLRSGQVPVLILGIDSLPGYSQARLPYSPLQGLLGELDLSERFGGMGRVLIASSNRLPAFHNLSFDRLDLNLLQLARLPTASAVVLDVAVGQQRYPLLLADSLDAPKCLIMLNDATWKWAMNPEPRVRYQYRLFWNTLFAWLLGEDASEFPLKLEVHDSVDPEAVAEIRVQPRDLAAFGELRELALAATFAGSGEQQSLTLTRRGDAFVHPLAYPQQLPSAIYLQASARYRGRQWLSERRPVVVENDSRETLDTAPQSAILQALTGDRPGAFAWADGAAPLIDAFVRPLDQEIPRPPVRQRDYRLELLLICMMFLVVAVEWFLERHLHERPT